MAIKNLNKWFDGFVIGIVDKLIPNQFISFEAMIKRIEELGNKDILGIEPITLRVMLQKSLKRLSKKKFLWGPRYKNHIAWYAKRFDGQIGPPRLPENISTNEVEYAPITDAVKFSNRAFRRS